MNNVISAVILAIIQGISEWFPISSSGHLVLFSKLLGFDNSVEFDVALHFGTLMAVFVYFGKDIVDILEGWLKGKWESENSKLGGFLVIATIPAAIAGYFFKNLIEGAFQSLWIVILGFGVTGLLLIIASLDFSKKKKINARDSFLIGIAQAFAILPGISRSGATISSGLLLGLNEKMAVKFSFLLAIPAIFGAAILEIGNNKLPPEMIWATLVSFGVGLLTIHLLLKILINSKKNLRWFALYVLLLALALGVYLLVK